MNSHRAIAAAILGTGLWAHNSAFGQECPSVRVVPSAYKALDHFGRSLSLDNNLLAVGSSEYDGARANSGAVFIYQYDAGAWNHTTILTPANATSGDRFGESVSLSGNTLAIGAFGDDDRGTNAGAVYIFALVQGQWMQHTKLTAQDTAAGDRFGTSVSLVDDLLVVGAPQSDVAAPDAGAAYTFRKHNNQWTQTSRLDLADPDPGDAFGHAVDTDYDRILIGAYLDDASGTDSGSATVFALNQGLWTRQAHVIPDDGRTNDWFGFNQVTIDGNMLAIGALNDDDRGTNSGSVYTYEFNNTWRLKQKLAPIQLGPTDNFGKSLMLDDNVLIVGARFDDEIAWNSGAAYLFDIVNAQWRQRGILTAPLGRAGDEFGRGIAIGRGRVAIGAHKHYVAGQAEVGAAWIYDLAQCDPCYADCDQSTGLGTLDVFDFLCFQNAFVAAQTYACDCDTTTGPGVCDVFDFLCFQNEFVNGCP